LFEEEEEEGFEEEEVDDIGDDVELVDDDEDVEHVVLDDDDENTYSPLEQFMILCFVCYVFYASLMWLCYFVSFKTSIILWCVLGETMMLCCDVL